VPVPVVHGGLEALNGDLQRRCREDLARRLWGKPASKAELLSEERPVLLPLPDESFVAARVEHRCVDSLSLVSFDANQYSVPTELAHHPVMVVASVDTVRIVAGDHVAAVYSRCWGREQVFYDPVHYLAVLERKPGALDFAAPLEGWQLPVCFGVLRRRLEAEFGGPGTRQFIKVLRLLEWADPIWLSAQDRAKCNLKVPGATLFGRPALRFLTDRHMDSAFRLGYHRSNVARRSSFRTCVRTWSNRCAPRSVPRSPPALLENQYSGLPALVVPACTLQLSLYINDKNFVTHVTPGEPLLFGLHPICEYIRLSNQKALIHHLLEIERD